ncbi:ankyrin repeat [Fusarium albosuccineum]|uniref:Ankyrin repeat n=1 Tax=Fusarium albosuccineum TaxID=1237068 RepID=A0A8H4PFC1_9HYPO|nr:ankyrin repeat [Fusarium albosuccineum]
MVSPTLGTTPGPKAPTDELEPGILLDQGADVDQTDEDDWTSLHFAAQFSTSWEVLDMLLKAGANVAARSNRGSTALHCAARAPNPEAVRFLVSRGFSTEARTNQGRFALHSAAEEGCSESIRILLDANADMECEDQDGWTPLHFASSGGHLEAVQLLIDRGAIVSSRSHHSRTPLHVAAHQGRSDIVKHLVKSGVDITATDGDRRTALHTVVLSNSLVTTQALLEYDVDIEARDRDGETPLATAVIDNAVEIAGLLVENKANLEAATDTGDKLLHLAVARNLQQMMQLLIENGADVESRDSMGWTPLLDAARQGKAEVVRFLADHGADVMATSNAGATAIHLATPTQNKPLIRLLIKHGVSVDARARNTAETVLMTAAREGNPEIVSLLIQQGADVNAADTDGRRPLHFAATDGHERAVEILLENGANPIAETASGLRPRHFSKGQGHDAITKLLNESTPVSLEAIKESEARSATALLLAAKSGHQARVMQIIDERANIDLLDIDGRSALSVAAEHGHKDLVLALVERKADLSLVDANGASPLWWASRYGHETIVELLLDQGARINTPDTDRQSPLSVATQHGHLATVKLLLERGAKPNSSTGYGKTALMFAVITRNLHMVELLLRFGADANYVTPQGDTALSLAEENGDQELANAIRAAPTYYSTESDETTSSGYLSLSGSFLSTSTMDRRYSSMLLQASANGRLAEMERLIRAGADPEGYGDGETPLYMAAAFGQLDAVVALVEHEADPFHRDEQGRTALTAAARGGHVSIIRLLHELGDCLELRVKTGRGPLLEAASKGQTEDVALLLDLGAKSESKDSRGGTPLWYAATNGHRAVVELLLAHGANIESANKSGCTPLMAAVKSRDRTVARLLLERGAHMRPESIQNLSPLGFAASAGDEAMVDLLLDHRADLNYASDNKRTALHLATLEGNTMVLKMLIEAGAKVDVKDADGRTAFSLAKEKSHDSAVHVLSQARSLRQASQRSARKAEEQGLRRRASYQYQPLTKTNSIRVLELHPGRPGDILRFDLNEVQLNVNASFEALSYEWQDKFGSVPVQCNNEQLLVTPNCKAAMERLRLDSGPRYLWIDAICINQANTKERNQQVAMMTDIYRAATSVLMWLGEETESTRTAFEVLPMMAKARNMFLRASGKLPLDSPSVGEDDDPHELVKRLLQGKGVVEAFSNLLRRTYWSRAWIFQEIVLAGSRGVAICGSQHCQWMVLKHALLASMEHPSTPFASSIFSINYVEDKLLRVGKISLGDAAWTLYYLDATDPRDKIFASLGLASANDNSSVKWPVADYTMTTQEVYVHAARYIIDVDDISEAWRLGIQHSTKAVPHLPSWVPDFKPRDDGMMLNPFPGSELLFKLDIMMRPFTTESSLQIGGCIVDKVIFKLTMTKKHDAYSILLPAAHALARQGRGIYDTYPVGREPESGRDKDEAPKSREPEQPVPRSTNAEALFSTMMDLSKSLVEKSTTAADDYHQIMLGFLASSLSKDNDAPDQSRQTPNYAQQASEQWATMADDEDNFEDFTLSQLKRMEDMLRYGSDLIYTKNGFFGLTNGGEAEEGMSVALIGNSAEFRLLRKGEGRERYYEHVDIVYFNFLGEKIDKLEKISQDAKIERIELR